MDDGTDDGMDGWKGPPPPSQPDKTKDIIYKDNMWSSVRTYSRGELYKLVESMKTRAIRVQICQGFNGLSFICLTLIHWHPSRTLRGK